MKGKNTQLDLQQLLKQNSEEAIDQAARKEGALKILREYFKDRMIQPKSIGESHGPNSSKSQP